MSTNTEHFNLIKPDMSDPADITALNGNWDTIDSKLQEHEGALGEYKTELGGLQDTLDAVDQTYIVEATSYSDNTYVATNEKITTLKTGLTISFIPNTNSTTASVSLKLNNFEAMRIYQSLTSATASNSPAQNSNWLSAGKPILLTYVKSGSSGMWKTVGMRTTADDLYGTLPISKGGTGSTTVDQTPTENSTNMVFSGGVYNALLPLNTAIATKQSTIDGNVCYGGQMCVKHLTYSGQYNHGSNQTNPVVIETGFIPLGVMFTSAEYPEEHSFTTFKNFVVNNYMVNHYQGDIYTNVKVRERATGEEVVAKVCWGKDRIWITAIEDSVTDYTYFNEAGVSYHVVVFGISAPEA